MLWIGLAAMTAASLGVHLGLFEGMLKVGMKIGRCAKCSTFWLALACYLLTGTEPVTAAALSLLFAYLSHWFGIALVSLNNLYTLLWQRVNRNR